MSEQQDCRQHNLQLGNHTVADALHVQPCWITRPNSESDMSIRPANIWHHYMFCADLCAEVRQRRTRFGRQLVGIVMTSVTYFTQKPYESPCLALSYCPPDALLSNNLVAVCRAGHGSQNSTCGSSSRSLWEVRGADVAMCVQLAMFGPSAIRVAFAMSWGSCETLMRHYSAACNTCS